MKKRLPVVKDSPLPPLYARWLQEALPGPIPGEPRASCDACAMAPGEGGAPDADQFDPGIKCCSFLPDLPNFLVGQIMARTGRDADAGRASTLERIEARVAVGPLGIGVPASYAAVYQLGAQRGAYGRSHALRCVHFVDAGGKCGIWRDRQSVCATWFCKHTRGAVAWEFWNRGVRELLTVAEAALARHCVLALEIGAEALDRIFPPSGPGTGREPEDLGQLDGVDDHTFRARWGRWAGRELEFYARCAQLVATMSWRDVLEAGGAQLRARAEILAAHYVRLRGAELPPSVRPGSFEIVDLRADRARVVTYSQYDPLELPSRLLPLLHLFDGRPTRQVLRTLAREHDLALDDALVRQLIDYQVLV